MDAAACRMLWNVAILYQSTLTAGDNGFGTDDVLNDIAADLADGEIDAVASGIAVASYNDAALTRSRSGSFAIPGDDREELLET